MQDIEPKLMLYKDWFEILNPYSVQFRYPGDNLTLEEAKIALKTAKDIRKLFLDLLPSELF